MATYQCEQCPIHCVLHIRDDDVIPDHCPNESNTYGKEANWQLIGMIPK